jgi:hypothetical protein
MLEIIYMLVSALKKEIDIAKKAIVENQEPEWRLKFKELNSLLDLCERLRDQEKGLLSHAEITKLEIDLRRHLSKYPYLTEESEH